MRIVSSLLSPAAADKPFSQEYCANVESAVQRLAFLLFQTTHYSESYAIILGTSAIALSYNIVHSVMIQQTSAVTTTVIGQAKIVGLLILSALLLGKCSASNLACLVLSRALLATRPMSR